MELLMLGGTGAMGRNIVDLLRDSKHELYITSRQTHESRGNVHYIQRNARVEDISDILKMKKWDAIIDFMIYPSEAFRGKIEELLQSTAHYFFFSSCRVFAEHEIINEHSMKLLDQCDNMEYVHSDEYAISKAKEENLISGLPNHNWTIIRPYITYDTYRLQLGTFEKENWLYRALKGRTVVLDSQLATRNTTMTCAADLAKRIVALIEEPKAFGMTYNITTAEYMSWRSVLEVYNDAFEKVTGSRFKTKEARLSEMKIVYGPQYYYDRMYNRVFDNGLINSVIGNNEYVALKDGINQCIEDFMARPLFKNIDWILQARMDKVAHEYTKLSEIGGIKNKMRYMLYRFIKK